MTVPYHTVIGIEIESNNMSIEEYKAALKLGEREASSLSAKKRKPLPCRFGRYTKENS